MTSKKSDRGNRREDENGQQPVASSEERAGRFPEGSVAEGGAEKKGRKRKHLRRQLERSEGQFELLVQAVKEYAIFMLDTEGYVQSWNDGAERIKGYSRDEIVGRHFSNFYTEADREAGRPETGLRSAKEEGQWTDEGWRVRKDGTRFWARVTITALFDEEEELRGFAKVTRDMTERHRYEKELADAYEQLKETERLKDKFFANVSHELRTPLTLILSPVESMLAEAHTEDGSNDLSPKHRQRLETVHNNSIRMLQMVNGLLDFSKLEIGEVEVEREPTDIEQLTQTIYQDFLPLGERQGVELEIDSTLEHSVVEMDRYLYERILFNLLSNAVKYTPKGGEIWVRLTQEGDQLEVTVADTGEGIPEDELENIFKDFRQVDASSTRRFEGTGLGLPLVSEFAELLDGDVSVESTLGVGSTFTVDLRAPVSDRTGEPAEGPRLHTLAQQYSQGNVPANADEGLAFKEAAPEGQQAETGSSSGEQEREELSEIVLAEDNDGLSSYIRELLSGICTVYRAQDGEEAMTLVREIEPEMVLTDIMMPKKNGLDVCQELKANPATADIPVVMLTALTNRKALLRGWEAGADEYLFKPFHPKELVTRIRTLLRNIERRKEAEEEQKKLEQELLQASERERRRIGQTLHDGLASHMTGLSTLTQSLMAKGAEDGDSLTVDARSLQRIVDLAQEGARQARTMARGLNPVKLDQKGLPAALQTLAENQEFRFGVTCTFDQDGLLPELPKDASINLYWIAHEAVHNAIKHGEADRLSIQLHGGEQVVLEVIDDGRGLPSPVEELKEGMGLATMRYRAELVGASLEIRDRDEGGVHVACKLEDPSVSEEAAV